MLKADSNELSERELEILKLVATGVSNKEIARQLSISSNTVKVHLRNIFSKIGAASRTEAAMYAVRLGLVQNASAVITTSEDFNKPSDNQLGLSGDLDIALEKSLSRRQNARRWFIYVGSSFGLILIIILSIFFLQRDNNPARTLAAPTSTSRVQWFELPGLPTPREGLAVVNYDNQIYAFGGATSAGISDIVERFNPQASSWTTLTPMPRKLTDISAAAIGGLIYIPGGELPSGFPSNETEIFNPKQNQWSTGIPLPKPLSAYALTVFEGRIYLFGGWDGNQVVNDSFYFDYHNNSWVSLQPMPTARSSASAVVVDGKIYVIGGWSGKQALTTNEVYTPGTSEESSQWQLAPSLPNGQYGMGVANLANIIFAIGGVQSNKSHSTIALIPEETDWVMIDSPFTNSWSFLGATTIGTRLYALGGKTDTGLNDQMWSYQAIYTISLPIVK